MNDEVKLILTKLKIVSEEKENGAYICDKEHSKLLLSYIEQLKKRNKELYEGFMATQEELTDYATKNEQLENNRDDAIEMLETYKRMLSLYSQRVNIFDLQDVIDELKGDSE